MARITVYRVRRPAQYGYKPSRSFRALQDVDPEKLKLLAAIGVEFNSAEESLDWMLQLLIGNIELGDEIVSRINGLEGKIEIAKCACHQSLTLSGGPAEAICEALSWFMALKSYRDALAHVRLHNEADDIVFTFMKRGKLYEADISLDTLRAVYEHMYHLTEEMASPHGMAEHNWPEEDLENPRTEY